MKNFANIRRRLRLSTDTAAVWTALAVALLVRWGWLKHVSW